MQVLITGGATIEPIDGVRYVTNFSTGKTAYELYTKFSSELETTILLSKNHHIPDLIHESSTLNYFTTSDSLEKLLLLEVKRNRPLVVIHLAAVSDYIPYQISQCDQIGYGKISSENSELVITLKKRSKIINQIKSANSNVTLIGFKLTNGATKEDQRNAVLKLLNASSADYVVHNDLTKISKDQHLTTIYNRAGEIVFTGTTKDELIQKLLEISNNSIRSNL